ncbi:hypothetical protein PHPALM_10115 [Phytophthora palmivora]|uniref:Uncharacterized protein n=1 Tax=Phytophthora palmivora TaxID=4796 RepID=A0A2P4Y5J4_9STRA|nr:hypothetical protein PHPALM_10115 [Phytophthora palmivora]
MPDLQSSNEVWNATTKRTKDQADDDYHGNFDTKKIERWLTKLCQTLKSEHGPCNIHMDGASYHKNQTNKGPTMNWSRLKMLRY